MGCYGGREWVSLGGVGHVELSEEYFGLASSRDKDRESSMVDVLDFYKCLNVA